MDENGSGGWGAAAEGTGLMRWSDREVTAYHEAGHAVIGRVLDLACGDVTIIPDFDEGSAGCAITNDVWDIVGHWMDKGRSYGEDAALRARIIAYMAGAEAEIACCGEAFGGDDDDRRQIDLMLDSLLPTGASLPSYEARLRMIARGLVRRHRERIQRVAAALLDRTTLSDAEIRQVAVMGGLSAADRGEQGLGWHGAMADPWSSSR